MHVWLPSWLVSITDHFPLLLLTIVTCCFPVIGNLCCFTSYCLSIIWCHVMIVWNRLNLSGTKGEHIKIPAISERKINVSEHGDINSGQLSVTAACRLVHGGLTRPITVQCTFWVLRLSRQSCIGRYGHIFTVHRCTRYTMVPLLKDTFLMWANFLFGRKYCEYIHMYDAPSHQRTPL